MSEARKAIFARLNQRKISTKKHDFQAPLATKHLNKTEAKKLLIEKLQENRAEVYSLSATNWTDTLTKIATEKGLKTWLVGNNLSEAEQANNALKRISNEIAVISYDSDYETLRETLFHQIDVSITSVKAAIAETGSTVMWWQAYGGAIMLSKDGPVKTPADMVGKKARVFGKTLGDFVTSTGGAPTLISGSEQYLAYQRGTVDIGMTGVSGVKSRKLWEVMDTITVTNHADIEFIVVANTDWWNGLSAEHQKVMSDAALMAELTVRNKVTEIEAGAYAAAEEAGMNVYHPTAEEIDAWKAASASVYDGYRAKTGDLGAQILSAAEQY